LQVALLVHLAAVARGLGALLATSGSAFAALRLAGACYLVWPGVEKWRQPIVTPASSAPAASRRMLFRQGLLVNLANPKAIVFIAALVPQFIDTGSPRGPQFALIAATLCLVDVAVMSGYALAGARIGPWLSAPGSMRAQNRIFGGLFIVAGLVLALAPRQP
jgi:homoserine/homoserine lactone efflux protein